MKVFYKSINRISDNNGTRYHFIRRAEAVGHTKRIQEIWNPLNSCHIVEVGYRRAGQIKRNPSDFADWVQLHLYQRIAYKIITGFVGSFFWPFDLWGQMTPPGVQTCFATWSKSCPQIRFRHILCSSIKTLCYNKKQKRRTNLFRQSTK